MHGHTLEETGPLLQGILTVGVIFTKTHPVEGRYALIAVGCVGLDGQHRCHMAMSVSAAQRLLSELQKCIPRAMELDREPS